MTQTKSPIASDGGLLASFYGIASVIDNISRVIAINLDLEHHYPQLWTNKPENPDIWLRSFTLTT